jgi:hypothetical protein
MAELQEKTSELRRLRHMKNRGDSVTCESWPEEYHTRDKELSRLFGQHKFERRPLLSQNEILIPSNGINGGSMGFFV